MRILGVFAALAAVLALSGCSSYTNEEQTYLQEAQELGGWQMDSETEEREALDFGYFVCSQLRDGYSMTDLLHDNLGGGANPYVKTEAIHSASVWLCPGAGR